MRPLLTYVQRIHRRTDTYDDNQVLTFARVLKQKYRKRRGRSFKRNQCREIGFLGIRRRICFLFSTPCWWDTSQRPARTVGVQHETTRIFVERTIWGGKKTKTKKQTWKLCDSNTWVRPYFSPLSQKIEEKSNVSRFQWNSVDVMYRTWRMTVRKPSWSTGRGRQNSPGRLWSGNWPVS